MRELIGIVPPMATPFDSNEEIDHGVLERETRFLKGSGVHGLSFAGSTGEGAVLSDQEIGAGLDTVQRVNDGSLPLICGVIRNSTRDALETARTARSAGVDALMVTPVHYFGASPQGNTEFYERIGELGLPIIIYNVIQRNPIGPDLMRRLSRIPNVYGVKQSVGGVHALADMVAAVPDGISVFGAHDDLLLDDYVLGSVGAISAILTLFPALFVEQWDAVRSGDIARAREIHYRVLPVWRAIEGAYFPARLKAALELLGRPVGPARHPMVAPDADDLGVITSRLMAAGFCE